MSENETAIFLVSFKIFFKRKNLFLFFEKLNRTLYGLKNCFRRFCAVFRQKTNNGSFKLIFVSARLWKLDTCIVFLPMFMLFPVYTLLFLSEIISFLHYSTMQKPLLCLQQISINKPPFACNNYQRTNHRSIATIIKTVIRCFAWN